MTQAEQYEAIQAAIDAQFATPRVVSLEDAPHVQVDHILMFVSRRFTADRRYSGEVTVPGGRVVVRYVAKTGDNVRVMRARVFAALEDHILTAPTEVGPFTFETEDDIAVDEGWFVASDTFTY